MSTTQFSKLQQMVQMIHKHEWLVDEQMKKSAELDRQDQIEQEKFIDSLGR